MRLTYVPDGYVALKPKGWLPTATDEDWVAHADHLDDNGYLVAGLGGLLVQRGRRALLIDAGAGPVDVPDMAENPITGEMRSGALLDNLAKVDGLGSIEAVAITHLHFDHLGWTLQAGAGAVTPFRDARYYVGETEWRWWRSLTPAMIDTFPEWSRGSLPNRQVLDIIAARVDTVADGARVFPGVHAVAIPGHTTGHLGFSIRSRGRRMIAFGDTFHSPVQISHPEWVAAVDFEPEDAVEHRRELIERLADSGDLAFGIHFADVPFGRVRRDDSGRATWVPCD
ncbi:MBL fold metallo-hydrolase [Nocardia sp. NEAU-351]|uniref:MBL fold metallo-hydrolase n=1 Tax=Nocardia bovistercoris TaxID=2785916 RepID=A0A931IAB1_9NOCA|nr:MBL fold metallo-hydrolase [Nocardia bovistercoris]